MDLKQLHKLQATIVSKIQRGYQDKNHLIEAIVLLKSIRKILRSKTDGQN